MKKVVCIGEMLIDMVDVDHKGLLLAQNFVLNPGGASANVAIACARLSTETYYLGALGNDSFGKRLRNVLEDNKVNVDFVDHIGNTTIAWVGLDDDGERSFEFLRGSDGKYEIKKSTLDIIDENTIVHFGSATALLGDELEKSYDTLKDKTIEVQGTVVFDPNYRELLVNDVESYRNKTINYIEVSDYVKLSLEELELISEEKDIEAAINKVSHIMKKSAVLFVTLGSKGCYVISEEISKIVPSIEITQVDATGAGDAFIGALISQLAKGETDLEIAVRYANRAGAITATHVGAINSLPTEKELQSN